MAAQVDTLGALVDLLKADAAVTALVGTRVFGGELEEAQAAPMPRAAIVLRYSGGLVGGLVTGVGFADLIDVSVPRVDAFYYGATPFEADRLRRTAFPIWKNLSRFVQGDVLLHWARKSGGPIPLRDPDAKWPLVFESWTVMASDLAIAA